MKELEEKHWDEVTSSKQLKTQRYERFFKRIIGCCTDSCNVRIIVLDHD